MRVSQFLARPSAFHFSRNSFTEYAFDVWRPLRFCPVVALLRDRAVAACRAAATAARGQYPAAGPSAPRSGGPSLLPGARAYRRVPCRIPLRRPSHRRSRPRRKSWKCAIEGNKAVETHKILPHIKTRAGRPLDKSMVEDDVKRLSKTHQFINVEPRYRAHAPTAAIVIIYHVVERPLIRYLKIYGSHESGKNPDEEGGAENRRRPRSLRRRGSPHQGRRISVTRRPMRQASVTIIEGTKPGDRGVRHDGQRGTEAKDLVRQLRGQYRRAR